MRLNIVITILGLIWTPFLQAAIADNIATVAGKEPPTKLAEDVDGLVKQLSDNNFYIRKTASRKLWHTGLEALPALQVIAEGKDPEGASRARELILYISAGILPDSAEEIKTLVIDFSRSDTDKKLKILRKLMDLGHWRQVLHLARLQKDEETRLKMVSIAKTKANQVLREAIVNKNHNLVDEVLDLMGDDDRTLIMRAWHYKQRGQLAGQLKTAAKIMGEKGARWRLALHRVDGNVNAALHEARALGDKNIIAAIQLLQGDPLPWLLADPPEIRFGVIPSLANRIQLARIQGDKKKARILALELMTMARNSPSNNRVIAALSGVGFRDLAIKVMTENEPLSAFVYFDNMEAPEQALRLLGIPQGASAPYEKWVRKTTSQALEEDKYSGYSKILMMGGFLARHGERKHVLPTVLPLMNALEKDESDIWFDLIYSMAIYDLCAEAIYLVEKRGNKNGEADLAVKKIFRIIKEQSVVHVWEALKKRNNQDLKKSLHQIAILSGLIQDKFNEVDDLHDAMLAEIKDNKAVDEKLRHSAIFAFAETRGDLDACAQMLQAKQKVEVWFEAKRYYDKELFNWEEMESQYTAKIKENPSDFRSATHLYVALRKQGKEQEAKKMLGRVLSLTVGEPSILGPVASELYKVGFYRKATELWLQILLISRPGDIYFNRALSSLTKNPQYLYDTGQWRKSSAIAEVSVILALRGNTNLSINELLRARFKVDFARGMAELKEGKRKQALTTLDAARKLVPGDGTLADHFFPSLRTAGIGKIYDKWFNESYNHIAKAGVLYPRSHNTHNTAAWLCSRAGRKLDEATKHSVAALKERPQQGAYLDTMAEICFAKGNRAKAIEWSKKAVEASRRYPQGVFRMRKYIFENFHQLHLQLERFKTVPLSE